MRRSQSGGIDPMTVMEFSTDARQQARVSHLCIGPFRAQGVNLSGSDFVAGIPSPSSALGFVGAIARRLGVAGWDHKAILIIHDLEERRGRVRGEQKQAGKGTITPLEISESVTGHGVFSIVAEIPGQHDVTDIISAVMRMRFAGGAIFAPYGHALPDVVHPIQDGDLLSALMRLPRGMVLSPPTDRSGTSIVSFGEETSLEAIAMRSYASEKQGGSGYIVPAPVGYKVLTQTLTQDPPAACRDRSIPFALVDSAVGLAEFVSVRNRDLFRDIDASFANHGWSWACRDDLRMFSQLHLDAAASQ